MKQQIEAILEPFRAEGYDAGCEWRGKFWAVWIGSHAGGREDGVELANDLAAQVRGAAKPVSVPEPVRAAKPVAEPEPLEIPAFLAPEPEAVEAPEAIRDLVRVGETYEQTNIRLLPPYREAQHMKERAIEDGDKTERVFWETKIRKIDLAMHWMHGRLIETV